MTIWKIRSINDFFSYEKNKFYVQILKNIDKHNFLGQFWVSYNIRHELSFIWTNYFDTCVIHVRLVVISVNFLVISVA